MYKLIIGNKVYSSWSLRPWVLMKTLGITFDEVNVELYTPEGKAEIVEYHAAGKVPLLIDTELDHTLWDSMAILEYLGENHPDKNLWPSDKIARAHARCVANEMHSSFNEVRNQLPMNCRADKTFSPIDAPLQKDIDRICNIWRECRENFGNKGDFLFGEFCIADAMFTPVVLRFNSYHIPVGDVEKTYMQSILQLPAVQEWISLGKQDATIFENYEI